jgi:hypothetical protein
VSLSAACVSKAFAACPCKVLDVSDVYAQALPGLSSTALLSWLHGSSTKHVEHVASRWLNNLFSPRVAETVLQVLHSLDQSRLRQVLLACEQLGQHVRYDRGFKVLEALLTHENHHTNMSLVALLLLASMQNGSHDNHDSLNICLHR